MQTVDSGAGPIHVVSTRDDARHLWSWLCARQTDVLGLDFETNAEDPFSSSFSQRLAQMASAKESWVIRSEQPGMREVVHHCVREHPYWIAHYAENDIRFAECQTPGTVHMDRLIPHIADLQPILAWYEPRTVTSADKPGIDIRIRLDRGLKPCAKRWLPDGQLLDEVENALHRRFLEISVEAGPYQMYIETVRRNAHLINRHEIEPNGTGVAIGRAFATLAISSSQKTGKGADSWNEKSLIEVAGNGHGEAAQLAKTIIALRKLNSASPLTAQARRSWGFAHISDDDPVFLKYAGLDPMMTVRLFEMVRYELQRRGQWPAVQKDVKRQWQLDLMTFRGMLTDGPYSKRLSENVKLTITQRQVFLGNHGVNPTGMGGGIGRAMERLGVTSTKTTNSGGDSWDASVLEAIASSKAARLPQHLEAVRLSQAILRVRQSTKFHAAYIQPMLDCQTRDRRIHCSMREIGTITTRNSAERPPMQQIPKRKSTAIRAAFCAPEGWVYVSADLRQGEPRVMAGLSGDKALLADILAGDINSALATLAYGDAFDPDPAVCKKAGTPSYFMRDRTKITWLSRCYGAGLDKLALTLGVPVDQMREIKSGWDGRYCKLTSYERQLNQQPAVVLESGWIAPLWDRYRFDTRLNKPVLDPSRRSRLGLNVAVQGNQAVLLKESRDRVYARGWGWALVMLVHDEIVGCVPVDQAEEFRQVLIDCMTTTFHGVPIECDATIDGPTWLPQKPFEEDDFDDELTEVFLELDK